MSAREVWGRQVDAWDVQARALRADADQLRRDASDRDAEADRLAAQIEEARVILSGG